MSIKVSAVICTLNRADYLRKALQSLVDQTLNVNHYEILVIDNCSTDGTKQIVTEEFSHVPNLRYCYEAKLGLSQARNTGWKQAQGEYIAYLDDDAVASAQWLEKILESFTAVTPQPGVVGGKVEPIWEAERPAWLSDKFLAYLSLIDLSDHPRFLNSNEILVGANIAFPKLLLENLGGFAAKLGRTGNSLLSCEEVALIEQIAERGLQRFYHPDASVGHHVHASRISANWFRKRFFWQGVSDAIVQIELKSLTRLGRIRLITQYLTDFLKKPKMKLGALLIEEHQYNLTLQADIQWQLGYTLALLGVRK